MAARKVTNPLVRKWTYIVYSNEVESSDLMPSWISLIQHGGGGADRYLSRDFQPIQSFVAFPVGRQHSESRPSIRVDEPKIRDALEPALRRIQELVQLGPNWDSYGGSPVSQNA